MRPLATLIAIAAVVGAFGVPIALPAAAHVARSTFPPATDAPAGAAEIAVDIVPAASGILRAGDDLSVTVTITNRTGGAKPAGTAILLVDRAVVAGRAELAGWLGHAPAPAPAADPAPAPAPAADRGVPVAISPTPALSVGQSLQLPPILVPAATLGFDATTAFGAHAVSVRVEAGGIRLGEGRSAITLNPGVVPPASGLAVAMPLALPPSAAGIIPPDLLATYTATGGILFRQLDQAYGRQVAIGIDPRIIASIRILGDTAPPSATEWLRRLESAPNQTFPLSYADTDVAATSQSGGGVPRPTLFAAASGTGPPAPATAPSPGAPGPSPSGTPMTAESLDAWNYTLTGVAWPRDSTVVAADLESFAAAGLTTTIVASDNLERSATSATPRAATPNAATTIGGRAVMASDASVSVLIREAVGAASDLAWQSAMVRLTASLATLALDRGPNVGPVLATLDRRWPLGDYRLAQTLGAIAALPWVTGSTMTSAAASAPTDGTIVDRAVDPDRIAQLTAMFAAEASVGQFATALADPALLTTERRLSLLAVASQAWTVSQPGAPDWAAAVADYLKRSGETVASVRVVESSTTNLLADKGSIYIPVSNALPYPVTVYVTVRPATAILSVRDSRVELIVEPNSQRRASIPVESIANGEVTISISLETAAGVPVSQPTFAKVNVAAGWETAATTVLAILVVVLFAVGVVRTVRRRRRFARDDQASDATAPVTAKTHE